MLGCSRSAATCSQIQTRCQQTIIKLNSQLKEEMLLSSNELLGTTQTTNQSTSTPLHLLTAVTLQIQLFTHKHIKSLNICKSTAETISLLAEDEFYIWTYNST